MPSSTCRGSAATPLCSAPVRPMKDPSRTMSGSCMSSMSWAGQGSTWQEPKPCTWPGCCSSWTKATSAAGSTTTIRPAEIGKATCLARKMRTAVPAQSWHMSPALSFRTAKGNRPPRNTMAGARCTATPWIFWRTFRPLVWNRNCKPPFLPKLRIPFSTGWSWIRNATTKIPSCQSERSLLLMTRRNKGCCCSIHRRTKTYMSGPT